VTYRFWAVVVLCAYNPLDQFCAAVNSMARFPSNLPGRWLAVGATSELCVCVCVGYHRHVTTCLHYGSQLWRPCEASVRVVYICTQLRVSETPNRTHKPVGFAVPVCLASMLTPTGNESVPIQLAQCWFLGTAVSNAAI